MYQAALMVLSGLCIISLFTLDKQINEINLLTLEEIAKNWNTPFITDVFTVGKEEICDSNKYREKGNFFDLFSLTWFGLREAYYKDGVTYNKKHLPKRTYLNPFPMIQMTVFKGRKICA